MSGLKLDLTYDSTLTQGTGVGLGVGDLTIASAVSGEYAMLRGDHAALARDAADGYWLTVEVAPRSISSVFFEVGFCDSDRTDYARFLFDTSVDATYLRLETRDGSTQNALTLPYTPAADTFVTLDLVWTADFVAGLVDGADTAPLTANLPGADFTPYVLVGTRTSATKTLRVESVTLQALNGTIANPATDPLLTS